MFRTELNVEKSTFKISLRSKILLIGSCFSDAIGKRLISNKINAISNPFGNIYNPCSIFSLLNNTLKDQGEEEFTFLETNGRWLNYNVHSEIYASSKEHLASDIEVIKSKNKEYLREADAVIITLGTAYVYKLIEQNKVVANCHKSSSKNFTKLLLSPKEIIEEYEVFRNYLLELNPQIKILFTVSPVRHIKDTMPLNNVSKSVLRLSIHYICESFAEASYFPAYELLIDDLRDYRFYKEDMIHPTEVAENYIWEKFALSYFDSETNTFIREWQKVSKSLKHKPFHSESEEYQNFLRSTFSKIKELSHHTDLDSEMQLLKSRMVEKPIE